MEFNFSVNALFREKIIKVKNNLLPDTYVSDRYGDGDVISKISTVLDNMGAVSAKAQNLPRVITTAAKLKSSDHVVYLLADPKGNKGHGSVVGLLKVGHKKLFVYDKSGDQMEIEPLCVLDFYVHESKQRSGYGHQLFDHMLEDQETAPEHLALDQPSEIFLKFMGKHYGLDTILPQNNGFVVFESFFKDRAFGENIRAPRHLVYMNKNPVQVVKTSSRAGHEFQVFGRHSAKKAETTMGQYMQGGEHSQLNGNRYGEPVWPGNQYRVPLAQYGQYWSSVGQLLEEQDDEETTDGTQSESVQHRVRKVSNIPLGDVTTQVDEEDFDAEMDYVPNGLNGNGTTRDVRFKKTLFQNLSPYRR